MDWINYSNLLIGLSFTFCLSLTAGGILAIFRIEKSDRHAASQYLHYFLIFLYVFGYYSLWSQILISQFLDIENLVRLTTIVSQMGVPFFVISLVMQLIWAFRVQGSPAKFIFPITLAIGLTVAIVFWQWRWPVADPVRAAYSLAAFVVAVVVCFIFARGKNAIASRKWGNCLLALVLSAGLIHLSYFTQLAQYQHYDTVFVFLFFLCNTAMVVVHIYTSELGPTDLSFDDFATKYNITKREADIILGIYDGKTNKEIADKLFITVQTVKDHSSRIYQKTFVKNRAQLATLLRDYRNVRDGNRENEALTN